MREIQIVADSTCDLTKELISQYGIKIIPLCVVMDDKSYYDGEEITPDEIFAWADANKTTPKTAAVAFDKAESVLREDVDAGRDIIFFGISEDMSTTCQVIRILAEQMEYDRIFVINSMNLSTGIGLQVLRAAELAKAGKTAEEIVSEIEAARDKVRASFVVDTLTYLGRGGRCSAATAMLGNMLKLHPEIVVKDGKMGVDKKYRGKLGSSILKYAQELAPQLQNADLTRVFITHSGCDRDVVESVRSYLAENYQFENIIETRAGGVISSHCGPGTLGVLFYEK